METDVTGPEMVPSTHGVELALHHFGGQGPALLIVHATGMNAMAYRPMAARLAESFDVWALDLRAHGASTPPAGDEFAWTNMGDDVLAAIDHLGGEPLYAIGHSMGGTSVLLAELKRPGIIAKAWLFEPIIFPFDPTVRNSQMAENAHRRRSEFPTKADALARYASRPPLGIWRADALYGYVEGGFVDTASGTVELACRAEHEGAVFEHAGTRIDEIAHLDLVVTIASGRFEDGPSPAEFAQSTAEALRNARHVNYPELTHFGPLQNPDLMAHDAAASLLDSGG